MSNEEIKAIARRFRGDLWNTGDLSIADQIIDRQCIVHARIPLVTDFTSGPEAMKQLVGFYHLTFSDIETSVDQIVAEGDVVAVRWSARGRHTGDLFGVPPTGREVVTSGIDMLRIVDGLIVEGWVSWDALSLLEQVVVRSGAGQAEAAADFLSLVASLRRDA